MTGNAMLILVAALGIAGISYAADSAPPTAVCASCHGVQGEGNQALGAPRLAGQNAAYLTRQLHNFKEGKRAYDPEDKNGATMRAAAIALADADIATLAAFYSGLTVKAAAAPLVKQADMTAAKEVYAATCAACHGFQAQGFPQLQAPSLQGLGDWYIARQIDDFAKGRRGDAEKSDQPAVWMRTVATLVSQPKELADVIQYIDSLAPPAPK
jgi:cytochrome c553